MELHILYLLLVSNPVKALKIKVIHVSESQRILIVQLNGWVVLSILQLFYKSPTAHALFLKKRFKGAYISFAAS